MADTTFEMIKTIDTAKFASNVVKEQYDALRELISALLLLDGFKTKGEGAHKLMIQYLGKSYKQFSEFEISILDDLRITRNRIAYNGFFVTADYLEINGAVIQLIIAKLKEIINNKLTNRS